MVAVETTWTTTIAASPNTTPASNKCRSWLACAIRVLISVNFRMNKATNKISDYNEYQEYKNKQYPVEEYGIE